MQTLHKQKINFYLSYHLNEQIGLELLQNNGINVYETK